jgi:hypothetical protein
VIPAGDSQIEFSKTASSDAVFCFRGNGIQKRAKIPQHKAEKFSK